MAESALALLWSQTQAFTAALVLVALLRGPLRRACGAEAAFWVWNLVPALAIAALWLLAAWAPLAVEFAGPGLLQPLPRLAAALPPAAPAGMATTLWLLAAWALGLAAVLAGLLRGQRQLHRMLVADAAQGIWRLPAGHSPALVGLWRAPPGLATGF